MYAEELRYSEIKPPEMSGNQFSYHLDKLLAEKLVEKNINGFYSLTIKGMRLTDTLSNKTMKTTVQPKLAVGVFMEQDGKVLLQRRGRQPFPGTWSLPASRIRLGEQPLDAPRRVLDERMEANIEADFLKLISIRFIGNEHQFLTDLMYLVYKAEEGASYMPNSERYVFTDVASQEKLFPGTVDVIEAVNGSSSISQADVDLKEYSHLTPKKMAK